MTSLEDMSAIVREVRQRVTRIESRICRLGDHLEIQLINPKDGLEILLETDDVVEISTSVMDITLSELVSYLCKRRLNDREANIYFRDKLVACIYPTT